MGENDENICFSQKTQLLPKRKKISSNDFIAQFSTPVSFGEHTGARVQDDVQASYQVSFSVFRALCLGCTKPV